MSGREDCNRKFTDFISSPCSPLDRMIRRCDWTPLRTENVAVSQWIVIAWHFSNTLSEVRRRSLRWRWLLYFRCTMYWDTGILNKRASPKPSTLWIWASVRRHQSFRTLLLFYTNMANTRQKSRILRRLWIFLGRSVPYRKRTSCAEFTYFQDTIQTHTLNSKTRTSMA
jgi:hypothetical protein